MTMVPNHFLRRRARHPFALLLLGLAAVSLWLVSLGLAYRAGTSEQHARSEQLEAELQLREQLVRNFSRRAALAEQRLAEREHAASAQPEAATPELVGVSRDELEALGSLIDKQLHAGVAMNQLRDAVLQLTPAPAGSPCTGEPEIRNFLARTPVTRDPSTAVFASGQVTVVGSGVSVRNASNGRPEAWFDTAQPVAVQIELGGTTTTAEGKLPFSHAVRYEGKDYRFDLHPYKKRGFIEVAMTVCEAAA